MLTEKISEKIYDLIVVGAGPAGLMAALFAKRQGMNVIVLNSPEQQSNMELSHVVENHPGIKKIQGARLLQKMRDQVANAGVNIINEKTIGIIKDKHFTVLTDNRTYGALSIVIATGLVSRRANIPGEERLLGKGVSYCVLCDGPLFVGKDVAIMGGGDSAVTGAVVLKEMGAKKVYIIHRRDEFRAEKANIEKLEKAGIEKTMYSVIEEITGKNSVHAIKIKNLNTGNEIELSVDGVFIEIGYVPTAELAKNLGVHLDENGFIKVNSDMETDVKGVFAAGDITNPKYKLMIGAYYQGSIAGLSASKYVSDLKGSGFTAKLY